VVDDPHADRRADALEIVAQRGIVDDAEHARR
jgi:hypothetical protein